MQAILGGAQRWILLAALLAALGLAAPERAWAQPEATGLNVIAVFFSLDGKLVDGGFRAMGDGQWEEHDGQGRFKHSFTEVERRRSMVTLRDPERDVYIYLDFASQQVLLAWGKDDERRPFYPIIESVAGNHEHPDSGVASSTAPAEQQVAGQQVAEQQVTGLNVIEVFYSNDDGKTIHGGFRTFGGGQWQENDGQGNPKHDFTEVERRQWLVTLVDPKREVYIYLDVGNQRVLLSYGKNETPFEMYRIVWSQAGKVMPAVTGMTANEVVYSADGVVPLGKFVHVGQGAWVEVNAKDEAIFQFGEYIRGTNLIVLRDYARGMEIRLDLTAKLISWNYANETPQPLYTILSVK
jgi:hypothetical protein